MFEELKYPWKSAFSTQGLKLQIFVYSYDDFVADNDDNDRNDNFELNAINKKKHSLKSNNNNELLNHSTGQKIDLN